MTYTIPLLHDGISWPLPDPDLIVLNLGVGLQSSTLLEMADRGEFGRKPDVAFFSDTEWEPPKVYEFLAYLRERVSIPIETVGRGSLRTKVMQGGSSMIPAFVGGSPINRGCTRDFKVVPIEKAIRARMGWTGRPAPKTPVVEQWFGITTDEIQRVRRSRNSWAHYRYPLIEARMSRTDCERYREARQMSPAPWSSCVGCPFHGNAEWREIMADPVTRADAIAVDASLRDPTIKRTKTRGEMFLHRSGLPLDQVDFSTEDPRQGQLGFINECEGLCGV